MSSPDDRASTRPYDLAFDVAMRRARRALIQRRSDEHECARTVCDALAGPTGPFDAAVVAWTDHQGLTLPIAATGLEGEELLLVVCEALAGDRLVPAGGAGADEAAPLPPEAEAHGFRWMCVVPVPGHSGGRGRLGLFAHEPLRCASWRGALVDLGDDLGAAVLRAQEEAAVAQELAALRGDRERLRAILDVAPAAINVNRARDGRYVDVNRHFLELMGYERQQVLGRTSLELGIWADPEDRERLVALLQRTGRVTDIEAPFLDARGQTHIGAMSARLQTLHGEPHIVSVTLDVTARERAARSLRAVIEAAPDAMLVLDAARGEVLFANPAGHGLRASLGPDATGALAGGGEAAEAPGMIDVARPGEPSRTFSVRRAEVTWRDQPAVLVSARDVSLAAFHTRVLQALHALSRRIFEADETMTPALLEQLAGALESGEAWWYDAQTPERSLGRGPAQIARVVGRMRAGAPPPCVDELRRGGQRLLLGGQLAFCATCPARPPAHAASVVTRVDLDGEPLGVLGVRAVRADAESKSYESLLSMITQSLEVASERRRSREREEVAKARAREAERLEALGRLAGGVAHDFNNLLTIILSAARFLERTGTLTPAQLDDLHSIRDAGQRAAALTSKLLAYGRRQLLRKQVFDCNHRLRGLEDMIARLVGEDVEVVREGSEASLVVRADPNELERAVMNLVTNARAAMPDGGVLGLRLRHADVDDDELLKLPAMADGEAMVLSSGARPGSFAVLEVTDTGHGIDGETLPRVFEPFFTTRGLGEGTGLGLSMVEGILHQSGGFVSVRSRPGVGTRVALYVPLYDEPAQAVGPAPFPPRDLLFGGQDRAPLGARPAILVVEDEENIRQLLVRTLATEGGYEIREAQNLEEAAAVLATGFPVTLLVSDVVMPGGSGVDVAHLVRHRRPEVRILYVSGYPRAELERRGALDGTAHVLPKPFLPGDLLRAVEEVLAGGDEGAAGERGGASEASV